MARRYHRFGDAHAAVDVGFMSTFLAIDVLLNFIPGPKRMPVAAARMVRPATRAVLGRIHRLRMTARGLERLAPPPVAQLKGLERFKINGVPQGAVALKGVGEKGVYVLDGELFVADDSHHYPLYRRGNEHALRLKNRQAPGQDELIVHVHQPREWLLGADAPQPVAGSSSTVLSPWRAPVQAPPDWQPPTVRAATQNRIYRSPAPNPYWFEWRVQDATGHVSGLSAFGTFHVHREPPGFPYDAVYIGPQYDSLAASGRGITGCFIRATMHPGMASRSSPAMSRWFRWPVLILSVGPALRWANSPFRYHAAYRVSGRCMPLCLTGRWSNQWGRRFPA